MFDKCDHLVFAVKAIQKTDKEFWVVYNSLDRILGTINVVIGNETTAVPGVTLNLETDILNGDLDQGYIIKPLFNTFAVSHKGSKIVASSCGNIGHTDKFVFFSNDSTARQEYYTNVLRMWDLSDAHADWISDKSCSPVPLVEINPVLAKLLNPDPLPSEKCGDPEGYLVAAIEFSQNDRFVAMILITKDYGQTYSTFMSICDSETLQPLWTMNSVVGYNCPNLPNRGGIILSH